MVNVIQPRITEAMNSELCRGFQDEEIFKALKQMHPKKSLAPNGMPHLFYQHYWSLVGNYVTQTVLDFLNHGTFLPKFNETHIALIPKVKDLTKIT